MCGAPGEILVFTGRNLWPVVWGSLVQRPPAACLYGDTGIPLAHCGRLGAHRGRPKTRNWLLAIVGVCSVVSKPCR